MAGQGRGFLQIQYHGRPTARGAWIRYSIMAILTSNSDKKLLINDDIPEMRSSLRGQVAGLGI